LIDELEEQVGTATGDGEVTDLVHDQQRGSGVEADLLGQSSLTFGLRQSIDQFGQSAAIHATARQQVQHMGLGCQSARKTDPSLASKIDPLNAVCSGA